MKVKKIIVLIILIFFFININVNFIQAINLNNEDETYNIIKSEIEENIKEKDENKEIIKEKLENNENDMEETNEMSNANNIEKKIEENEDRVEQEMQQKDKENAEKTEEDMVKDNVKNVEENKDNKLMILNNNQTEEEKNQEYLKSNAKNNDEEIPLEDGVFFICSALNNNKVIDISAGSVDNCANVQVWENANVLQQKFTIKKLSDGYYSIECYKSKKCLDVASGEAKDGNNVWQYDKNGTDAQKWMLKYSGFGYYNIISKCGDYYLDITDSIIDNGTNIRISKKNNSDSQKFKLKKVDEFWGKQTLEDGAYTISIAKNTNKVLDVSAASIENSANIQIWDNANVDQQIFILTYIGDGLYTVKNYNSGKVLDVRYGEGVSGNNVWQYEFNNTNAQKWVIKDLGDGYYNIISRCDGYYLDVENGNTENGTNVRIYSKTENILQKFKITKIDDLIVKPVIQDGIYTISTKLDSNKVIDICGGSKASKANVQIWDNANVKQQKFKITHLGDGIYQIKSINSNKVLDVANGSRNSGANVWQYEDNNSDAQKWSLRKAEDGYYYIVSKIEKLCLDVSGGMTNNGNNVIVYTSNQTDAQKFKFNKINVNGIDISTFNGNINWANVKKSDIDFSFIRIGYRGYGSGKIVKDSRYSGNIQNATSNGIDCGVYFVTQAINYEEGKEEANWVLNQVKQDIIKLPIVIDIEWAGGTEGNNGRADYISVSQRTEAVKGFCETIKNSGYIPMIYASKYWLESYLNLEQLSSYDVWIAHYVKGAPEKKSDYKGKYKYWQYTAKGSINGINGYVDLNISY